MVGVVKAAVEAATPRAVGVANGRWVAALLRTEMARTAEW